MSIIIMDSLYKNKYVNIGPAVLNKQEHMVPVMQPRALRNVPPSPQKKQTCQGKPTCKPFPGPGNPALFLTSPRPLISSPGKKWLKLINRTNKY
jgi:hypothetical protein